MILGIGKEQKGLVTGFLEKYSFLVSQEDGFLEIYTTVELIHSGIMNI